MRLFLSILLLVSPACSPQSDPENEQVTLEQNKQQIREEALEAGRTARGTAPAAENVAQGTPRSVESEVDDAGRKGPQKPEDQTATVGPQVPGPTAPAAPAAAPSLSGRELVQTKCSTCHSLQVALAAPRSAANWAEMVEAMTGHGMVVTQAERRLIQNHLESCCLSSAAP